VIGEEKMAGLHVKKGDKVVVIAGKDKGKKGKILHAFPSTKRVVVEGANMIKKHVRPTQKSPQGGIVERPGSIDASNVQLICPQCDEPARLGATRNEEGKRLRVCRKCEGEIDKS
jgi:large subunit ribosomal protein L24